MIDPKRVELVNFNSLPHLAAPVVVDSDKALMALRWLNLEMDNRYLKFAQVGARNIDGYNKNRQLGEGLPYIVLVIDGDSRLRPCALPYDKKVAGGVSGANGYSPGIVMDDSLAPEKRLPVALNGKVYCKVDAGFSAIEVGDLLTTSPVEGHAMKATDQSKAFGAVIGKALGSLDTGCGLIPVLVSLQ